MASFLLILHVLVLLTSGVSAQAFQLSRSHGRLQKVKVASVVDNHQDLATKIPSSSAIPNSARLVAAMALMEKKKHESPMFPLQRLEADPKFQSLDQRSRSFAKLMVLTTMRRKGQIDKVLSQCRKETFQNQRKFDLLADACLRLGAAQILFLDVASHAAVKETVDVLRLMPGIKVSETKVKFVNAVLRRLVDEGESLLEEHSSNTDNLAPWLVKELKENWGDDATETVVKSVIESSPIHLSLNHPMGSTNKERELLTDRVLECFEGELLQQGSITVPASLSGSVSNWPLYKEGLWWVQDPAATIPALALSSSLQKDGGGDLSNFHVVDMCAAPGGKTSQLASLGFGRVTAVEANERRSRRLMENLERLRIQDRCSVVVQDGTRWVPREDEKIDGIIVDVPCSATGTARKRPDVLWREEDLGNLLDIQWQLATHCADKVLATGGVMVYATCSMLKRESETQAQKLLSRPEGSQLETVPFQAGEIPGFDSAIDENGWLRILPGCIEGSLRTCDGFFVARLRKVS